MCRSDDSDLPRCNVCHALVPDDTLSECDNCHSSRPLEGWMRLVRSVNFQGMKLYGELGRGSMGVVYLGLKRWRGGLSKWFAVKVCTDWENRDQHWNAIKEEGAVLARFSKDSPVIQVWRWDLTPDEVPFQVMKLAGGRTLRHALDRDGPIDPRRLVRLATQLTHVLEDVHKHGLIHLALSPRNLFLTDEGTADERFLLSDFGMALELPGVRPDLSYHAIRFRRGVAHGIAPRYVPPELTEILEGSIETALTGLDERADIYSTGMVLYHALTNRSPFGLPSIPSVEQWFRAHRIIEPLNPREWDTTLPDELCSLVMRCIAKSPFDRFQDATELRDALAKFLDRDEISVLRARSIELERSSSVLTSRVEDLQERLTETERTLDATEEALSEEVNTRLEYERSVKRADERAEDYARELDAVKHLLDELRVSKMRETASRLEAEGRVSALQDKTAKLQEARKHLDAKYHEVRDTFHGKLEAFTRVNREKAELAEERDRLAESMRENARLQTRLDQKRKSAETAFETTRKQRARLEGDVTKLTEDYWNAIAQAEDEKKRRKEAERLAEEEKKRREETEELVEEARQTHQETDDVAEQEKKRRRDLASLAEREMTRRQELESLAEEEKKRRRELEHLADGEKKKRLIAEGIAESEEKRRKEAELLADELERKMESLAKEVERSHESSEAAQDDEQELAELEGKLEETLAERNRAQALVTAEKAYRKETERQARSFEKRYKSTAEQLGKARKTAAALEKNLKNTTRELKRALPRVEKAEAEKEKEQEEREKAEIHVAELNEKLWNLTGEMVQTQDASRESVKKVTDAKTKLEHNLRRATEKFKQEKQRAESVISAKEQAEGKLAELESRLEEVSQELEWIRGIATEEQQARESAVTQLAEAKFLLNKYRNLVDPPDGDEETAESQDTRASKLVKTKRLLSAEIKAHKETSSYLRSEMTKRTNAEQELRTLKRLLAGKGEDEA